MEHHRFDAMTKIAAAAYSRRLLLGGLAGGPLAALLGRAGEAQEASRRNGRCLQEKKDCKRDNQCCSGRCRGKQSQKKCRRVPGQGTCTTDRNLCRVGFEAAACNGNPACGCGVTTRGTAFCATLGCGPACDSDADCAGAAGYGPGAVCISLAGSFCAGGECGVPRMCVKPCGVEPTAAGREGRAAGVAA